jgi:two-component system LytT family response regulator
MIRSIIIDDEDDGRNTLRLMLERYFPEIAIDGIYSDPRDGMKSITQTQPDLVFLDIQMPQMSGFDLLKQLSPVTFEVIFVTAHDQYAIKAIRFSALDYLLKPVDIDDLRTAVEKAKERIAQKVSPAHHIQSVFNNIQHKGGKIERLAIPTLEGIELFNTADIIFCKAEGSYTSLMFSGGKSQIVSRNLKEFESMLSDSGFCRVHHSFLINIQHVKKYIKGEGGYVIMTDNHTVDISRRKKEEFLNLLDKV